MKKKTNKSNKSLMVEMMDKIDPTFNLNEGWRNVTNDAGEPMGQEYEYDQNDPEYYEQDDDPYAQDNYVSANMDNVKDMIEGDGDFVVDIPMGSITHKESGKQFSFSFDEDRTGRNLAPKLNLMPMEGIDGPTKSVPIYNDPEDMSYSVEEVLKYMRGGLQEEMNLSDEADWEKDSEYMAYLGEYTYPDNAATYKKLLDTAMQDGHITPEQANAEYIVKTAQEIATEFDEMGLDTHWDRLYEKFLTTISDIGTLNLKLNEGAEEVINWEHDPIKDTVLIKFKDGSVEIFNYFDDEDSTVDYHAGTDSGKATLLFKNNDNTKVAKFSAFSPTGNPDSPDYEIEDLVSVESSLNEKDDKWIQKAVNPDHEGYCTPMTKDTCTPPRKALAKRFKKGIEDEGVNEGAAYDEYIKRYHDRLREMNANPELLKHVTIAQVNDAAAEKDIETIDTIYELLFNKG